MSIDRGFTGEELERFESALYPEKQVFRVVRGNTYHLIEAFSQKDAERIYENAAPYISDSWRGMGVAQ